jgi:hypothetical protein
MLSLYTDINVDGALTRALRSHGVDVITAQEDGGHGKPDVAILNRATELGRLLVTADQDFLIEATKRQRSNESFCGIIFLVQLDHAINVWLQDILLIVEACTENELAGRVTFLPL